MNLLRIAACVLSLGVAIIAFEGMHAGGQGADKQQPALSGAKKQKQGTDRPTGVYHGSLSYARLPLVVKDLFGGKTRFNLLNSAGADFNLVDSTVAPAVSGTSPWILFKGFAPDTWFFAPRWGRLGKRPDGTPNFTLTVKRTTLPSGEQQYVGGTLAFFYELALELPSDPEIKEWHERIKALYAIVPLTGKFNFQPLGLFKGNMNVFGLDSKILAGQVTKNISIGASSTIAFAYELTGQAAGDYYKQILLSQTIPPQVAIVSDFKYRYRYPTCSIHVFGNKKKTYDYFSVDVKARASYFGLVNGSAEYSKTRADLKTLGGIQVEVLGSPTGVDKDKLVQSLTDRFIIQEVGQWIKPDPTPVSAPDAGGFFGGVSVAVKDVSLMETEEWDIRMDFADILEDVHKLSFNFEGGLSTLDPKKHVVLIEDDRKLDLKVVIGRSEYVDRTSVIASYKKNGADIQVKVPDLDGNGGVTTGVIQWASGIEPKPTSAAFELTTIYKSPYTSFTYKETKPVSDSGVLFKLNPNDFLNRTDLLFAMDYKDKSSAAACQWKWTPPMGSSSVPVSKIILVGVDQSVDYNPPLVHIEFPLAPTDFSGGKLEVFVKGLRGDWAGKQTKFELAIGTDSKIVDWDKQKAPRSLRSLLSAQEKAKKQRKQGKPKSREKRRGSSR